MTVLSQGNDLKIHFQPGAVARLAAVCVSTRELPAAAVPVLLPAIITPLLMIALAFAW
jgi:hypothetical protein